MQGIGPSENLTIFLSHCTECFNWFYLQYTCLLCCHVTENLNILNDCTVKHANNKVPGTGVFDLL